MTVKILLCAFVVAATLAIAFLCAVVKRRRVRKIFNALGCVWVVCLISAYAYFAVL